MTLGSNKIKNLGVVKDKVLEPCLFLFPVTLVAGKHADLLTRGVSNE